MNFKRSEYKKIRAGDDGRPYRWGCGCSGIKAIPYQQITAEMLRRSSVGVKGVLTIRCDAAVVKLWVRQGRLDYGRVRGQFYGAFA
jgi:hypothetical protein